VLEVGDSSASLGPRLGEAKAIAFILGDRACLKNLLTAAQHLESRGTHPHPPLRQASLTAPFRARPPIAAGTLSIGTWDHWVPGASQVLEKICQDWGGKGKGRAPNSNLITSNGDKDLLDL